MNLNIINAQNFQFRQNTFIARQTTNERFSEHFIVDKQLLFLLSLLIGMVDIRLAGIKENCYQSKFRKSKNEFLFHIMFLKNGKIIIENY